MKPYRDKTMSTAFSNVNGEWKYMVRLAIRIREGRYTPVVEQEYRKKFTGIYKRLLEDPMNELYTERDGHKQKAS